VAAEFLRAIFSAQRVQSAYKFAWTIGTSFHTRALR
jgi:hypothetical protein